VPDTETVKQVLAWFAERPFRAGLDVRRRFGGDYRTVIDRASDAVTDLEDAADFVESTGLDELAAAVKEAEDDGDYAAARRGRRAWRPSVRSDVRRPVKRIRTLRRPAKPGASRAMWTRGITFTPVAEPL